MEKEQLLEFLGPSLAVTPEAVLLEKKVRTHYTFEVLQLTLNDIETVPAYFAYPNAEKGPYPLVIFNHSHGGNFEVGKSELVRSSDYLQQESYLDTLIEAGYAVGSIDMWGFEERQGKKESELFKEFLLKGHTLWGLRLYDDQQFLTYLSSRAEVDPDRVATIGMSMGAMMSWWLAAIDDRVKVIVDIAGQAEYEALIKTRGLDHHNFYYYIPRVLEKHTTADIQKLIAPRPRLSLVGRNDPLCPLEGVLHLNQELQSIYEKFNRPENWQCKIVTGGHQETKEMRELWKQFLEKHL